MFIVNAADDINDGSCDGAHCSLREAINAANAANAGGGFSPPVPPALDRIEFNIGGGGFGVVITPSSPLPEITGPVVIDGKTQWPANEAPIGISGNLAGEGARGLSISGGGTTLRGLVIERFNGNGVEIVGPEGGNTIETSGIGDVIADAIDEGNGGYGVEIDNSPDNDIGGAIGVVISGNGRHGVFIFGAGSTGNIVRNSAIGLNYPAAQR